MVFLILVGLLIVMAIVALPELSVKLYVLVTMFLGISALVLFVTWQNLVMRFQQGRNYASNRASNQTTLLLSLLVGAVHTGDRS